MPRKIVDIGLDEENDAPVMCRLADQASPTARRALMRSTESKGLVTCGV